MPRLSAVVLTFNEEIHIARCIDSLRGVADEVFVIDSHSTDRTREIAKARGATVLSNRFINHARQFNWALDNAPLSGAWCLRIDADEYLSNELRASIQKVIQEGAPTEVDGYYLARAITFLGRKIKWSGFYPLWTLRLFRTGRGRCEERWMDEHIHVAGHAAKLRGDLVDENLKGLEWWIDKHNAYATKEAIEMLNIRHGFLRRPAAKLNNGTKRFLKERVYAKLPAGLRAGLYFFYRYVVMLGILDGRAGFYWCFFQGFWYRLLVDAKAAEIEARAAAEGCSIADAIKLEHGIDVRSDQ